MKYCIILAISLKKKFSNNTDTNEIIIANNRTVEFEENILPAVALIVKCLTKNATSWEKRKRTDSD